MIRRFEAERPAPKPADFEPWFDELGLFADLEGEWATIGVILRFAPMECVRYLGTQPARWEALLARARWADQARYVAGLVRGRRVGL